MYLCTPNFDAKLASVSVPPFTPDAAATQAVNKQTNLRKLKIKRISVQNNKKNQYEI